MPITIDITNRQITTLNDIIELTYHRINIIEYYLYELDGCILISGQFRPYSQLELITSSTTEWTLYTPLSNYSMSNRITVSIDITISGLHLLELSSLMDSINIINTIIITTISIIIISIFIMSILSISILLIISLPALTITITLLQIDRHLNTHQFNEVNEDPVIYQHLL